MVPRSTVLHARTACDGHRARLRPHHKRDWRSDDRLARGFDALLRYAERASRLAESRRREAGRDCLQNCGACRGCGTSPARSARPRRRFELCAFPFRLEQTVRTFARPGNCARDARRIFADDFYKEAKFCSMCGPKFCSMNITQLAKAEPGQDQAERKQKFAELLVKVQGAGA